MKQTKTMPMKEITVTKTEAVELEQALQIITKIEEKYEAKSAALDEKFSEGKDVDVQKINDYDEVSNSLAEAGLCILDVIEPNRPQPAVKRAKK